MYKVSIKESGHLWDKKNLVTKSGKGGSYDEMVCQNCGIIGRRYTLSSVSISESYAKDKAFDCPKAPKAEIPTKIRVVKCDANGAIFGNMTPGSEHDVVDPPKPYTNDSKGVWVMGVGEPIKLLTNEYEAI